MGAVTLTHDCDVGRRGDGSAPAGQGGDFRDCYIVSGAGQNNVYDGTQFDAGVDGAGGKGGGYYLRALLWFGLNYFIPAGATIINAVWHVYVYSNTSTAGQYFDVDRITQTGWVEGQSTWIDYKTATPWTSPGGDIAGPNIILGAITGAGWKSYNVFSMVSDAWTNRAGICTFLLRRNDGQMSTNGRLSIHAKNYLPYGADKPHHLRVTYTLAGSTFEAIVI